MTFCWTKCYGVFLGFFCKFSSGFWFYLLYKTEQLFLASPPISIIYLNLDKIFDKLFSPLK